MIQQITSPWQTQDWQEALRDIISDPVELAEALALPTDTFLQIQQAHKLFPLRIPVSIFNRIEGNNLNDPVLKQFLPQANETTIKQGFCSDPLNERAVNPASGLLHKFKNRVLLTVTQACAVHCRYCFRREFNYKENNPGKAGWTPALNYIVENTDIEEVILSGGDPLTVPDEYLEFLLERLSRIPHIKTLRIHTRLPVIIPQRITDTLLRVLTLNRLKIVMVLHCNHANEIDDNVLEACHLLREQGITLLNQAVLLKDINDSAQAHIALNKKLFDCGVLPYYLHLLDPVAGAHHFDVPENQAQQIMREINAALPGYLVPKLVREVPGSPAKQLISF
jgi:EF-P beta-lysylation protein EpmB